MKGISERLKDTLNALGYTPKTLASRLGVSEKSARRILSPGNDFKADEFLRICIATHLGLRAFEAAE